MFEKNGKLFVLKLKMLYLYYNNSERIYVSLLLFLCLTYTKILFYDELIYFN